MAIALIPDVGDAALYFEIAISKMLHSDVREELKTNALELINYLVSPTNRNEWLKKRFTPSKPPDPEKVTPAEAVCLELTDTLRKFAVTRLLDGVGIGQIGNALPMGPLHEIV